MTSSFRKYQGTGNDFILLEGSSISDLFPECLGQLDLTELSPSSIKRAQKLCDRHVGIGADGILLVLPAKEHTTRMKVINADGSIARMCGNGLRCVALHHSFKLVEDQVSLSLGKPRSTELKFDVETDSGHRACKVFLNNEPNSAQVEIDMGTISIEGETELPVNELQLRCILVNVGNPHAILFGRYDESEVRKLGPTLAKHIEFAPDGRNISFANVHHTHIDLFVWERGVGLTQACGTGATATAAAAWHQHLFPHDGCKVNVPGGELYIRPHGTSGATMRGDAQFVFEGTLRQFC